MNRIELLASLTKGSTCVCDVGCDHAHVLVQALTKYNCLRGIAADVAAGPLKAAMDNISSNKLEDRIHLQLSDGFKNIDEEFDTAVVAGMGGYLIRTILMDSLDKIKGKKLILEPNSDAPLVREFLVSHGFLIHDEYALYDANKYYEIMVALPGTMEYTKEEIEFGPILLMKRQDDFLKYYEKKIHMLRDIIKNMKNEEAKKEKQEMVNRIMEVVF